MPTWDQTTPYMDQSTGFRRITATHVLIGLHIAGLVASVILLSFSLAPLTAMALHRTYAIEQGWVWQFVTYGFTFGTSYMNLLGNHFWIMLFFPIMMIMLHQFGSELEAMLGARKFLTIFFAGQIYGGLAQCLYQYVSGVAMPTTGLLYPGIDAVIIMSGLMQPNRMVMFFFMLPMKMIHANLIIVGLTVLSSVPLFRLGQAPFATLGSVLAVYLMFKLEPRIDRWLDRRESRLARRRAEEVARVKMRVDDLLDKISRDGMQSLSAAERAFLERASRKVSNDPWDE